MSWTDPHVAHQGKRRGDPGSDPSTVEPIPHLRARLWAFWDALFPPTGPEPASLASSTSSLAPPSPATSASARNGTPAAAARQVLYVSHGAAIREFMSSLAAKAHDALLPATVEKRDTPRRVFEMCLPEAEAHALRTGARRIDNCSRTVIEMDWREGASPFWVPMHENEGALTLFFCRPAEEGRWHGRLLLYADDAHFVDSSRAPSPTANADVVE